MGGLTLFLKIPYATAQPDVTRKSSADSLRQSLAELKWSETEVSIPLKTITGHVYLRQQATEKAFKAKAPPAGVLHLATHALIDDQDPLNSKLIFAADVDTTEDGFLHAYELYNMQLNAEIAVLSACNSGMGKLNHGEGMMSLARGFLYAGVPSVIVSLWPVDDRAAAELTNYFYQGLKNNLSANEALHDAKLQYLNHANEVKANPLYWAGFIAIGESQRCIQTSQSFAWVKWAILIAGFTLAVFFFIRERRRKARAT